MRQSVCLGREAGWGAVWPALWSGNSNSRLRCHSRGRRSSGVSSEGRMPQAGATKTSGRILLIFGPLSSRAGCLQLGRTGRMAETLAIENAGG